MSAAAPTQSPQHWNAANKQKSPIVLAIGRRDLRGATRLCAPRT